MGPGTEPNGTAFGCSDSAFLLVAVEPALLRMGIGVADGLLVRDGRHSGTRPDGKAQAPVWLITDDGIEPLDWDAIPPRRLR